MKELIEKILNYMPGYMLIFGSVFSGPKTFIATRQLNTENEWADALIFLAISSALVAVMQFLVQPGKDLWAEVGGEAILVVIAVTLGATVLRISWWLVGGRASAQSFFITYAYSFGVIILILSAVQVLGIGVFKALAPDLYAKFLVKQATSSELTDSTVFRVVLAINVIGFLFASFWGFIAWGAYRQLNELTQTRSFYAAMIAGILSLPISVAVGFLGTALM